MRRSPGAWRAGRLSASLAAASAAMGARHCWRVAAFAALLAATALLAGCAGGDGETQLPDGPAADGRIEPRTPPPPATTTPSPAAGTVEATPHGDPQPPGREFAGLWAGPTDDLWLALRLTPGADPDADRWSFEVALIESLVLGGAPPTFRCEPERVEGGWEFSRCDGPADQRVRLSASLALEPEQRLTVAFDRPGVGGTVRVEAALRLVAPRDEPVSTANVSLAWHHDVAGALGPYSDIWVAGGLVFAPHLRGVIEILDAATGAPLGRIDVGAAPPIEAQGAVLPGVWDVKAAGGVLYAATTRKGLLIYDVADPANPQLLGQLRAFVGPGSRENFVDLHNIFLSPRGDVLYAINYTDLRLIDVSDPSAPREAGRLGADTAGTVHDINVIERDDRLIAYLHDLERGLSILDVTDPAAITSLGSIAWEGGFSHSGWPFRLGERRYYAHNDEGFDQGLTVLDVTDPGAPRIVSRFATRPGVSIHNVEVVGGIAYVAYYLDGLRVIDLRDPARPREIGHFDTVPATEERALVQGAWGVRVWEGRVYISDTETGIYAFTVDAP